MWEYRPWKRKRVVLVLDTAWIFILVPLFFYYYDPDIMGLALIDTMSVQSIWKPVWCVIASRVWTLLFAESTEWLKVFGASDPKRSLWPLVWEGSSSSLAVLSPPFMVIWIDIQGLIYGTGDGWCLLMVHLHHTGQHHLFLGNLALFNTHLFVLHAASFLKNKGGDKENITGIFAGRFWLTYF